MSASPHKSLVALGFSLLAAGAALVFAFYRTLNPPAPDFPSPSDQVPPLHDMRFAARERRLDETVWAVEKLAQNCGRTFDDFWDALNASSDKLRLAAAFPLGEIVLANWNPPQTLPHGIQLLTAGEARLSHTAEAWRRMVTEYDRAGWRLVCNEFRHNRFETNAAGQPRQSQFYFSAHLINSNLAERAIIEGDLTVDWAAQQSGKNAPAVKRIDASRLIVKTRHGEPPFHNILREEIVPPKNSKFIDPLILYDLDGDGLSEIVLAAKNLVYRRRADSKYQAETLCRHPPGLITSAVVADFDGDGAADFLCARVEGLFLYRGSPEGVFDEPGRLVWPSSPHLSNAMSITCGDIDRDGDLDVFVGQYRVPTLSQTLKPHYYDANDGHASYLLLNDGKGNFTDVTQPEGLGEKRWRRVYSSSFADLDGDGHLDLAVVSDFAGLDLYRNDGQGRFTDVTRQWIEESHAFGMALAPADFNGDGRLDILMMGMPSATVDRLEHLGLWRSDTDEDRSMRSRMTYGNRLYLARAEGGFAQTPMNDSMARSGWSWACGVLDFDNDGWPDLYISNGLESNKSVREYEPDFWLHDIHVNDSVDDLSATAYFMEQVGRTRGQGWSYGGYDKNRLYLNRDGRSFVEIGFLTGVALEPDSRNVVTDDLDGDGRVDLLLCTQEVWPEVKQTLRVFKNTLEDAGHWIGFRLREEGGGISPVGVRITIHYNDRAATSQIVTGNSHRSQHANTVHFGLGNASTVDSAEIRWTNGRILILRQPALNRYHLLRAPMTKPAS